MPRLLFLVGLTVCLACSAPDSAPDDSVATSSADTPGSAAAAPWYGQTRTLDLNGDGRSDSVRLEARGESPDSMKVSLVILVDGKEAHREAWGGSYELEMVDSAVRQARGAESILRAKLDSVLASVTVRALDAPATRLMLEDSAVLKGLDPRPTELVSFSYGFESTARLVWDATRRRFVPLWSCC